MGRQSSPYKSQVKKVGVINVPQVGLPFGSFKFKCPEDGDDEYPRDLVRQVISRANTPSKTKNEVARVEDVWVIDEAFRVEDRRILVDPRVPGYLPKWNCNGLLD